MENSAVMSGFIPAERANSATTDRNKAMCLSLLLGGDALEPAANNVPSVPLQRCPCLTVNNLQTGCHYGSSSG